MASLSMIAKAPIALSSSLQMSHSLLHNANATRIVARAVPRLKTVCARGRLWSEFYGARVCPVDSVATLKRGKPWANGVRAFHAAAASNTGEGFLKKSEELDGLKASQIKKVGETSELNCEIV